VGHDGPGWNRLGLLREGDVVALEVQIGSERTLYFECHYIDVKTGKSVTRRKTLSS
jgi:hypothetical protein